MTAVESARWLAAVALRPTLEDYLAEERITRTGPVIARHIFSGMLICWRMVPMLAAARGETVSETFKREALDCFPLHTIRAWSLGERKTRYPRWVKPRPRRDEPIDAGFCFVRSAQQLLRSVDALEEAPVN